MDYRTLKTQEHSKSLSNGISNYLIGSLIPKYWSEGKYPTAIKFIDNYTLDSDEATFTINKGDTFHVSVNTRADLRITFELNNELHNWSISNEYNYVIVAYEDYPEHTKIV